jgi:hypothetical protein
VAVGVLGAVCVFAPRASACSCVPTPSTAQALTSAIDVLTGRVMGIALDSDEGFVRLAVRVAGVYKGADEGFRTLVAPRGLCGFPVELGAEYLFYVEEQSSGRRIVSPCGRSKRLSAATEDLAALGVPSKPRDTDILARAREEEEKAKATKRAVAAVDAARTLADALRLAADLPGRWSFAFARSRAGCGTWGYAWGFAVQAYADARAFRECENRRGPQFEAPCELVPVTEMKLSLPETPSCFNAEGPIEP